MSLSSNNAANTGNLTQNGDRSDTLRHVDICYKFIRELVEEQAVSVTYVSSSNMVADVFTKALDQNLHGKMITPARHALGGVL